MQKLFSQHILLDSCIIEYLLSKNKNLRDKTEEKLTILRKNNYLYVSELTYFEVLRGIAKEEKEKAEEILKKFKKIPVTEERIGRSIVLYSKYKKDKNICQHLHSISDCDIMIGSLIFNETKPILLTADYWDFPRPFFSESKVEIIEYSKNRKNSSGKSKACLYIYYLAPNLEAFTSE